MKKKTNPIGIRFSEAKSELIKKKENLKSNQHLVDFLLDYYLNDNFKADEARKIEVKTETKGIILISKQVKEQPVNGFKTLQQLKDACPKELTGFARSEWIQINRVKYKI